MQLTHVLSFALWAALAACAAFAFSSAWKWCVADDSRRPFSLDDPKKQQGRPKNFVAEHVEGCGVGVTASEFTALWAFATLAPALLALMFGAPLPAVALVAAVGCAAPWLWLRSFKKRNRRRFSDDLGDALPLVAANLRAGMSIRQSLGPVARNMDEPIRGEFEILSRELDQGTPIDVALANMAKRNDNADLNLLAVAVGTQQQMGGNLADIVDTTAETIRVRAQLRRMVQSKTSEQRASARFLLLFPPVLVGAMCLIEATFRDYYASPAGWAVIAVAAVLEGMGFYAVNKMTDIRVD